MLFRSGGWDEGFVTPGGGYANLDIWVRACADPEAELIMLLGEATFHQVHGGNRPAALEALFYQEYRRLRGRDYERPTRRPLYFGAMPEIVMAHTKFANPAALPAGSRAETGAAAHQI